MEHPEADEYARLARHAAEGGLPPPPEPPERGECCERHCEPCVWDYYARALARWREAHAVEAL